MDTRDGRAREIQADIRQVLLQSWDPIGVQENHALSDEYDPYIGAVYRLIASGASAETIAAHLTRVEREELGFDRTQPADLINVGRLLAALDVRSERS